MNIVIGRVSCADTNYGEISILRAIIDDLLRMPDLNITVLSEIPEATETQHILGKINVVNSTYREIGSVIKEISKADIFVWAGGHLFHDEVSPLQVVDSLIKLSIPLFLNKPVFIWGTEFGPLKSPVLRLCARYILKRGTLITVRNPGSLQFCYQLAPIFRCVHLTTYPCLSLVKKSVSDAPTILHNHNIPRNRPLFGIVPRIVFNRRFGYLPLRLRLRFDLLGESFREQNDKLRQILADVADYAVKELGCQIIFFPMDTNPNTSDNTFVREIVKTMNHGRRARVVEGNYQTEEILSLFKQMELVLSMRLHGLIFASSQYVPVIAISSSNKFERYMEAIGQSDCCIARNELNEKELKDLIGTLLSKKDLIAETLKHKMKVLEGLASHNYKLFLKFQEARRKSELTHEKAWYL